MLFGVIATILLYSLLNFGAVQPSSWLIVGLALIGMAASSLVLTVLRRGTMSVSLVLLLCASVLATLSNSRLLISIVVGLYAWVAAREERSTLRFLRFLAGLGVAEAALALMQNFVSPGWIFGYVNQAARVSGTLINRNHFAGLMEMLVPATLGLAYVAARRSDDIARAYLYLLAGAAIGLALLLSNSRMGIMCFFLTLFLVGILLRIRNSQRRLAVGFTLTVLSLVVGGALWIGMDVIFQRYSELVGEDALLKEGRVVVYRDSVRMILANPFGVGIGNFQDCFREYQTYRPALLFDHAHNDYLETTAEWGTPIALVFWTLIGFAFVRAVRLFVSIDSPEHQGILLACIGAMFSLLLHSLADFNLQIPSNAMLFFAFVGISLATTQAQISGYLEGRGTHKDRRIALQIRGRDV